MGQQISVETFTSSRDPDGFKYWASFDSYPFKVGNKKLVYMGILNGEGPLKGQKCVVKTERNGAISRQEWELLSKRARVARDMANCYNKTIPQHNKKITFNCPVMAEIDTLSDCLCIGDILGKPKKKWNEAEFVSIELYLRGKFEDYEYGWVPLADLLDPEAFSHFTWCRSEGNMLVSNLQGVKTSCAYHFTGPVVHTENRKFGKSDLGPEGIKGFFKLHKCNQICRQWPRLGNGVDLRGWGEYIGMGQRYPTAPPLLVDLPLSPPPYEANDTTCVPYSRVDPVVANRQPVLFVRVEQTENETETCNSRELAQAQRYCVNQSLIPRQRQNSAAILREIPLQQTVYHQSSTAQWLLNGHQGFVIDWREEFLNQGMAFDPFFGGDNPMFQNGTTGMQLMWFVKQLRYTVFTPPPEYRPFETRGDEIVQRHNVTSGNGDSEKHLWEEEDNSNCLLPPPYSEESVDPELDCVTYL